MKKKDILTIVVVVVVSGITSLFVSNLVLGGPSHTQETASVVPVIPSDFPVPSSQYFNSQSFDPTQLIQIGGSSNTNPFSSTP